MAPLEDNRLRIVLNEIVWYGIQFYCIESNADLCSLVHQMKLYQIGLQLDIVGYRIKRSCNVLNEIELCAEVHPQPMMHNAHCLISTKFINVPSIYV